MGYPILVVFYLNYGDDIMQAALQNAAGAGDTVNTKIEPDIINTIIWIIMALFPILYHFIKRDSSNIFASSLIILLIAVFFIYIPGQIQYIQSVIFTANIASISVYKQYSLYEQLKIQQSWFVRDISTNPRNIKWIMYLFTHIFIYYHCFRTHNLVYINVVIQRMNMIIMPIPYLLLPTNPKYDLYFHRYQMVLFLISSQVLNPLYGILYYYYLKDCCLNDTLHTIILYGFIIVWAFSFVGMNQICNIFRQRGFKQIVNMNNNNFMDSWAQYVLLNQNTFQKFSCYMMNNGRCIFPNMLFVIEILQYKHAVLTKLSLAENDQYRFDGQRVIDGLNLSSLVDEINSMDLKDIALQRIEADFCALFGKYFDGDNDNLLKCTFVSEMELELIEDKLVNIEDIDSIEEILTVFDGAIKECDDILQLLYREYVIITFRSN